MANLAFAEMRSRRGKRPEPDVEPVRRSARTKKLRILSDAIAESSSLNSGTPPPFEAMDASDAVRRSARAIKQRLQDAAAEPSSLKAGAPPPVEAIDDSETDAEFAAIAEAELEQQDEEQERSAARVMEPEKKRVGVSRRSEDEKSDLCFVGDPVPDAEAKQRWPARYQRKRGIMSATSRSGDEEEFLRVKTHYNKARVDGVPYNLYDDVYIKADDGQPDYIGRIIEFFETIDKKLYFTAQWFFRAEDTVIKEHAHCHASKVVHDPRRVFLSTEKNDNLLDCIVSKVTIVRLEPSINLEAKQETIPCCDLYYDMAYSLAYSTFANLPPETTGTISESSSTISSVDSETSSSGQKNALSLLDLYSGCGAMSTGLCHGANMSGVNLETRWAVDLNKYACESLKLNHPDTEVRNEKAEDFLELLKEWEKLCEKYKLIGNTDLLAEDIEPIGSDDEDDNSSKVPNDEFEVRKLVGICFGDPARIGKVGLKFKVRWKGYGPSEDTWEPIDGLSKCQERIQDFVKYGYKKGILPLPGEVDVVCGGPPCQGISGFNRFRNRNAPLDDPKNQQMAVFMDIVEFLKPKYVLMENVVDILKFANGFLGRYALSRLVAMNYQARMGMMAAGCYGLPQFRMRAFLWGARPTEILPQFPLPSHDVIVRGVAPTEFEQNIVAYDENEKPELQKALLLGDAISDLPPVTNDENKDEMSYGGQPKTEFQQFIRLSRKELFDFSDVKKMSSAKLFDHRPLKLNDDDYQRVCKIPQRKGANFRDLPGVKVGHDNIVEWDPNVERLYLPSGKPLVPDYAMSFVKGKSIKPFGRLWWDETVPTVVTRAEPHNQTVLHPEQNRVLTIRENARLQGFPDYYQLCGPVKERYIQVGNAVAVPVSRALGYALGLSIQGNNFKGPLLTLPPNYPFLHRESRTRSVEAADSVE